MSTHDELHNNRANNHFFRLESACLTIASVCADCPLFGRALAAFSAHGNASSIRFRFFNAFARFDIMMLVVCPITIVPLVNPSIQTSVASGSRPDLASSTPRFAYAAYFILGFHSI